MSHPGLVLESFASRLLSNTTRNYHGVILDMKESFVEVVERHQQGKTHLVDHHLSLMQNVSISIPGCSLCVLKVPAHLLACGHKMCDHCLEMVVECRQEETCQSACPLCATMTEGLHVSPLRAGIRALGLSGSAVQVLKHLSEMRTGLMGPLGDYFDIIVCTDSCQAHADLRLAKLTKLQVPW